jgi:hypothetical protein
MSSHPTIAVTVMPAIGGFQIARMPAAIISTLKTMDHVLDAVGMSRARSVIGCAIGASSRGAAPPVSERARAPVIGGP